MKILPATDSNANTYSGVLVFQRQMEQELTPETPILEIFVAGDAACNIYTTVHGHISTRPMVHDLMYNVLSRAADINHSQWQLLRVAIVALENDIFVGRLFFGDAATNTVMWDCDCRPSDGVYLSLRTGCPFFVSRTVWEQAAVPIRLSKAHMIAAHEAHMAAMQQTQAVQQQAQQHGSAAGGNHGPTSTATGGSGAAHGHERHEGGGRGSIEDTHDYTVLKPDDFEAIKLLKRELAVAVHEEDYAAAIRLRDHPYMKLYRRMEAYEYVGRAQEATALRQELAAMIGNSDA